jgi:hypothetical protein
VYASQGLSGAFTRDFPQGTGPEGLQGFPVGPDDLLGPVDQEDEFGIFEQQLKRRGLRSGSNLPFQVLGIPPFSRLQGHGVSSFHVFLHPLNKFHTSIL